MAPRGGRPRGSARRRPACQQALRQLEILGGVHVHRGFRLIQQHRADAQVELFEKAPGGAVEITYHRTDARGIAMLPVRPGHAYMADAVVLRAPSAALAAERGVAWETLWAELNFAVPGE